MSERPSEEELRGVRYHLEQAFAEIASLVVERDTFERLFHDASAVATGLAVQLAAAEKALAAKEVQE